MTEDVKNVVLGIAGRHRDVRISIGGRAAKELSLGLSREGIKKEAFEGPYSVVSSVHGQEEYETVNKVMTENLVVLPIPYYETSNLTGGLTVYIGGD